MQRFFSVLLVVLLLAGGCSAAISRPDTASPFLCKVDNGYIVVTLSGTDAEQSRNPKYFGISSDSGFTYLNYPPAQADSTPYDLHTRILKLSIRDQYGIRYADGVPVRVKVFPGPGTYHLIFADDMETEPDNTFSLQCDVSLSATRFPDQVGRERS